MSSSAPPSDPPDLSDPLCQAAERRAALGRLTALALLAAGAGPSRAQPATPLSLGLAPYLSTAALLEAYRPLREQLSRALGQPVELFTARDFISLVREVRAGAHDMALLPAHVGRIALTDWGWQPLARTVQSTAVLVLVRDSGPVHGPADLRGGKVGMLDALSLTASVGVQWLRSQGLVTGKDVQIQAFPSINSAVIALERGELAAAVAAASQLQALPAQTPRGQRLLASLDDIPGPVIVARPNMPRELVLRVQQALVAVQPDPSRPRTAANSALTPLLASHLQGVEPYAAVARQVLAELR